MLIVTPPLNFATGMPAAEKTGGAAGAAETVPRADHAHPRLASARNEVLDANGVATVTFTRTFDVEPVPILTPITPGGSQPVTLEVTSWIKTGALWTGAVIKGYRGSLPTIATVTVLGVSVAAGTQPNLNPNAGSAADVKFGAVFIMPSTAAS